MIKLMNGRGMKRLVVSDIAGDRDVVSSIAWWYAG